MSNEDLELILDNRLNEIKSFEIELQGFSKIEDRFGNYLVLDVIKGIDIITKIHDTLCSNEFNICNLGLIIL